MFLLAFWNLSIFFSLFFFCSWVESQRRGFESRLQQMQTSDSIWQFFLIIGNQNLQIDPSMNGMVFSTFDWDQLGKILQHIKLNSKVINSESDLLKTNEDIAPQRREIYRHLHGGSGGGGGEGRGGVAWQVYAHHHTPLLWPLCRK